MGHLNGFFAPRGGNLNKPIFKSSNARGLPGAGGMLKLQFDRYIKKYLYKAPESILNIYFETRGPLKSFNLILITLLKLHFFCESVLL